MQHEKTKTKTDVAQHAAQSATVENKNLTTCVSPFDAEWSIIIIMGYRRFRRWNFDILSLYVRRMD
jgi:hypothetical protein